MTTFHNPSLRVEEGTSLSCVKNLLLLGLQPAMCAEKVQGVKKLYSKSQCAYVSVRVSAFHICFLLVQRCALWFLNQILK
jgi:hypothetical protein